MKLLDITVLSDAQKYQYLFFLMIMFVFFLLLFENQMSLNYSYIETSHIDQCYN